MALHGRAPLTIRLEALEAAAAELERAERIAERARARRDALIVAALDDQQAAPEKLTYVARAVHRSPGQVLRIVLRVYAA